MRFTSRLVAGLLLAAGAAACTDTRTINTPIPSGKVAGRISVNPVFSASAKTISASLADFGITFDHVRVRIRNTPDTNTVVADTTVAFGSTSSDLVLDIIVPVDRIGQQFNALVEYIGTSGAVYAGTVIVESHAPEDSPPEQGALLLNFVGPGAKLKTLTVSPDPVNLVGSQTLPLTIAATDSTGASLAIPPLVFASSDESVAKVVGTGSTRSVQSFGKRGNVIITAATPIGITDTLSALVSLPAASVAVVSGGDQTGTVGTQLPQPLVIQVSATDGVGVGGVTVIFAPPTGGSVGTATAVTDAAGRASTTLTLPTVAGGKAFSISAGSLPAISVGATAKAGPASAATSTIITNGPQINADNESSVTISVLTKDQFGNAISTGGATVTLTTTLGHFGGEAATTTTATDNGDGTYSATFRSAQSGTATITGTVGGTAIATPAVTVTAIATVLNRFDVTLADGTPITGNRPAGVATAVRIRALDLSGNVITFYNSQTTISITNSTLVGGGPDVVAPPAVNGVINTSVQFGRPGTNVQLVATGQGVTGQSAAFNVVAGPPALISTDAPSITYGMDATPQQYPSVSVTDGAGNIAAGQPVAFTLTGPCTFANESQSAEFRSDVEGAIQFNSSTLIIPTGGADFPFSCLLTANGSGYTALTVRIALLVRPSGGTVWTAHTNDAWETSDNWTNSTPSSSSAVFIAAAQPRATPVFPVIHSDNQLIPSIDVEDGAQLNLGGRTLNVYGSVDTHATGTMTNGMLNLSGGDPVRGTLPNVNCQSGSHDLTGITRVNGTLALSNCIVNVASTALFVDQSFSTAGEGGLVMNSANQAQLNGTATFGGTGSQLTNGILFAYGDFVQTGNGTFAPSGSHVVSLIPREGGAQSQSVTFADVTNSWFQKLSIRLEPGRTVTINSAVRVLGSLDVSSSTTGGGTLSLPVGLGAQQNGPISVAGTMGIDIGGTINTFSLTLSSGTVTLTGNGTLALPNGALILGPDLHLVIDVSGNLIAGPVGQGCTVKANVTVDGANKPAVAALKQACGIP